MLTDKWNEYLELFSEEKKDVYYMEEYVRAQVRGGDEPICFVYIEDNKCLLCPFLKRRVLFLDDEIYDVETPYGYGGPIVNNDDCDFASRAAGHMVDELRKEGVMAGFLRFHPLLGNQEILERQSFIEVVPLRETVVVDLSLSEESLWREQLHGKHRNAIRQAQRAGLSFQIDMEWRHLEDFRLLYEATMNRVEADEFYFFDREYFEGMSRLSPYAFLGVVLKDERCIAATVLLRNGIYGHYHLSASNRDAQKWRPNSFMLNESILAFKKQGVRWFHLGGAQDGARGNSLFQFKSRFSNEKRGFFIGKVLFNKDQYDTVCKQWESQYPEKQKRFGRFFLKYRFVG